MSTDPSRLLVVITGPTATGKTAVTIHLANHFSSCVISADSRQFYREMRVGTARPADDELQQVPHYFSGHLSVHDPYNIYRYEQEVLALLEKLFPRMPVVFMTGGSGLYIDAVCQGIDELPDPDPALREELKMKLRTEGVQALHQRLQELDPLYYEKVDRKNPGRLIRALEVCITTGKPYSELRKKRPVVRDFRILKFGLRVDRYELNRRIGERVEEMIKKGLVEEARQLYPFRHLNALNTLGYRELFDHFDRKITFEAAVEKIKTNTRRYAKRQMTWFSRDREIRWFRPEAVEEMIKLIQREVHSI